MAIEERMQTLMKKRWNINIECKAKGREYELTYETQGSRIPQPGATQDEITMSFNMIHGIGNTLDELLTNLEKQVANIEGGKF